MKSEILNVRIPQKLRNQLLNDADENDMSLSDYVRDILTHFYTEDSKKDGSRCSEKNLFNSYEFLFLVTWMIDLRTSEKDNKDVKTLDMLKNTCRKIMTDESIDEYLRGEFEKVFVDLTRYIQNYGSDGNSFTFCKRFHEHEFDYTCLIGHIKYIALNNGIQP